MTLSVIVPTHKRTASLKDALQSILNQTLDKYLYEIIVVDNKPTGEVRKIIQNLEQEWQRSLHYVEERNVGLHNARHTGAKMGRGEILVFIDDDIIATPGWLEAIKKRFSDQEVALMGGKILPKWESDVPDWINLFKSEVEYGWTIGYLSLLDFGNETKEIPASYVYGCNFSIRKSVLFECGGFHPDSMPQELIKYRGDGETALSMAIEEKGYKSVYEPEATVYHRVPTERLTVDYFCRRAFNQGVSDSFTEIRHRKGLSRFSVKNSFLGGFSKKLKRLYMYDSNKVNSEQPPVMNQVARAYKEGEYYHRNEVAKDPELLNYVLKEKYF